MLGFGSPFTRNTCVFNPIDDKGPTFFGPSMSISNQVKDYYWDKQDCPIPYTEAAMKFKVKTYKGSADEMK